jgi:dTDP-4-amino-4,6-dideoxygalactose transaminase
MIPFNKPSITGNELSYIEDAVKRGQLAGDGYYTKASQRLLESFFPRSKCLITHSCTAALEMCALLLDIEVGDEVIMPSYTFVSTANAFALRGAEIRYAEIDKDTLCIDIMSVERRITPRTKAVVAVHYAGVSCDMFALMELCTVNNITLIEDAAQAFLSTYSGQALGTFGSLATVSFHETKNIMSGEGGCLIINDQNLVSRAEVIREKGTNRASFYRGETDKYTWRDIGSSYLPGEIIAAFLYAQLESAHFLTSKRLGIWALYYSLLEPISGEKTFLVPRLPEYNKHNAHIFYLICHSRLCRDGLIDYLNALEIKAVFHYVPLHSSPKSLENGSSCEDLQITDTISNQLVRLPLYSELSHADVKMICKHIREYFGTTV